MKCKLNFNIYRTQQTKHLTSKTPLRLAPSLRQWTRQQGCPARDERNEATQRGHWMPMNVSYPLNTKCAGMFVVPGWAQSLRKYSSAEQPLRASVLWRRSRFVAQSQAESRFAERIVSVLVTSKEQHRHLF